MSLKPAVCCEWPLSPTASRLPDAPSGEEAMERLRAETPDVILLDLKMPGIGGLDTCRLIRKAPK